MFGIATSLLNDFLYDWDLLSKEVFLTPPDTGKPPWTWRTNVTDGKLESIDIFLALAGVSEEFVKVYEQNGSILIEVDNTSLDLPAKFQMKLTKKLTLNKSFDLEKVGVALEYGMLKLNVPLKQVEEKTKLLFGKK